MTFTTKPAANLLSQIDAVVAAHSFGIPASVKRGRRAEWPYVPIIDHGTHTEQLRGFAFATRDEAVAFAEKTIDLRRDALRHKLLEPRYRVLREHHGLPRELSLEVANV